MKNNWKVTFIKVLKLYESINLSWWLYIIKQYHSYSLLFFFTEDYEIRVFHELIYVYLEMWTMESAKFV